MFPLTNGGGNNGSHVDPTPTNNYLVNFIDSYHDIDVDQVYELQQGNSQAFRMKCWINPYTRMQNSMKPYIPCPHMGSIFFQNVNSSGFDACLLKIDCATCLIFVHLEPKDVANFSEVSKCCYIATKSDNIWQIQLKKLLPNVTRLSKFTCSFSSEQQFQIVFKKMCDRRKPFIAQINHNLERVSEIATKNQHVLQHTNDPNILHLLHTQKLSYVGNNFDGTWASASPDSQLGNCLRALNLMHAMEFDNQDAFEIIIQASETASQNSCFDSEPQVEEVADFGLDIDYNTTTNTNTK